MVMIEAMAVGCPVIAIDRGAASEVVAHGRSGFLVADASEMAQSISRIDELDREVVRAYAEHHFTARTMTEKYTAVYKKIIASSPAKIVAGRGSYKNAYAPISAPSIALAPLSAPKYVKRTASASGLDL